MPSLVVWSVFRRLAIESFKMCLVSWQQDRVILPLHNWGSSNHSCIDTTGTKEGPEGPEHFCFLGHWYETSVESWNSIDAHQNAPKHIDILPNILKHWVANTLKIFNNAIFIHSPFFDTSVMFRLSSMYGNVFFPSLLTQHSETKILFLDIVVSFSKKWHCCELGACLKLKTLHCMPLLNEIQTLSWISCWF